MKLFYCPACARVYNLDGDSSYLCGRNHAPSVWEDGTKRRFVISERSDSNRPPWVIPAVVEERELLQQDLVESWLNDCKYPEDKEYGDYTRHFGYGAPGGRHLTREAVVVKYRAYTLQPVVV